MPNLDPTDAETAEARCTACSAIVDPDDVHTDRDGDALCGDCAGHCPRCDETVAASGMTEVHSYTQSRTHGRRRQSAQWCDRCADHHTFHCDRCDREYDDDTSSSYVRSDTWCVRCVEDDASTCDACGELYSSEDGHSDDNGDGCYCSESCVPASDTDGVGDYHSTKRRGFTPMVPTMADYGYSRRRSRVLYFGVEHEVERSTHATIADCVRVAKDVLDETLAGIDSDSSLDDGIEAITQPCHVGRHRQTWAPHVGKRPFRRVATAHDTGTCGMHIHATRDAVSPLTWAKVLRLMGGVDAASAEWWAVVCRRRLSDTSYLASVARKPLRDCHDGRCSGGHYDVLNFSGDRTVEWRQPRGTTVPETIIGTIETFHAAIRFCQQAGFTEVNVGHFAEWLVATPWIRSDVKHAIAYLRRRGLLPTPPPRVDGRDKNHAKSVGHSLVTVQSVDFADADETVPASTDHVGCTEPTDENHPANAVDVLPGYDVDWTGSIPHAYVGGRLQRSAYLDVAALFHCPALPTDHAHPYCLDDVLRRAVWGLDEVYLSAFGWCGYGGATLRSLPESLREGLAAVAVGSAVAAMPRT